VIRVLIVASSAIARAGLEALLKETSNIEVIDSVASLEQTGSQDQDVIVVAGEIPQHVLELGQESNIVLLAADPQPAALEWIRSGVRAVLPRDAGPAQLIAAIEAAAAGLVVLRPEEIEPWLGSPKLDGPIEALTSREIEVLGMLAEGLANKIIAHRLGISEHTVKFHVTSIMEKLHAASRTEAVTLGIRRGLIML